MVARARRAAAARRTARVKLLPSVNADGVSPVLWAALGAIAVRHRAVTEQGLVVTSLRREPGTRRSLHAPPEGAIVEAADFRRWYLDWKSAAVNFCRRLQAEYGSFLGVVLEPEWLTEEQIDERGGIANVAPHVHVQLKAPGWPPLL